jgi:hypothetical protein
MGRLGAQRLLDERLIPGVGLISLRARQQGPGSARRGQ